jgi:hypothetical protein
MMRGIVCLLLMLVAAAPAAARDSWVSVRDLTGGRDLCLESDGRQFTYTALAPGQVAQATLGGPRRLKFISRYLYADGDDARVPYTVIVTVDGVEVMRKRHTAKMLRSYERCKGEGRVASLRRGYIELPAGQHDVTLSVIADGGGEVGIRLYRQVKRTRERWMAIAPEAYDGMRHLEFESGARSAYYHLDAATPLRLSLEGPTTLRVRPRLDFDHTMNGSQTFALDVLIDDQPWRTFHFDTTRLTSAIYLERPDILPGDRKEFQIPVPRGNHRIEIRCVRPEACGVAAMLHIPKRDLER